MQLPAQIDRCVAKADESPTEFQYPRMSPVEQDQQKKPGGKARVSASARPVSPMPGREDRHRQVQPDLDDRTQHRHASVLLGIPGAHTHFQPAMPHQPEQKAQRGPDHHLGFCWLEIEDYFYQRTNTHARTPPLAASGPAWRAGRG